MLLRISFSLFLFRTIVHPAFRTWNVTQSIEEYDETPEEELDTFSNDTTVSVTSTSVTSAADVDNGNKKYTYYLKFLKDLVNTTYESLNTFEEYVEDDTVNYLDVEKTIMEVKIWLELVCLLMK